jgi:hypothetical protein
VEDHDFKIWRALGDCLLGAANIELGQAEEGLIQVNRGIELYQGLTTPPVFWPQLLSIHPGRRARPGR